ncbi:MAG: TIR domain-containing protein [Nevskia sp.]|uniref:TIR domain-containing protein n=1 Tax=Nevskia sp. TaxID=1929292 RepID=UPI004036C9B8
MTAPAREHRRYAAFLNYSHRNDAEAQWLHRALERYRVPKRLVGQPGAHGPIGRRIGKVFRDREELSSGSDLAATVQAALADSDCLIAICSPEAARSRWVNEEILLWKRLGRGDRLLCLIIAGEPGASDMPGREHEECFAPALRRRLGPDGELGSESAEPIAADLRPGKDGKSDALLKLIAGLLGIGLDDLKRREQQRRVRLITGAAIAAALLAVIMGLLAVRATIASDAAQRRQKQAEALVEFMLGDLGDKLNEVSRLDIMETVNDQAMQYFQSLPPDDVTDEALAQRSRTLNKIGRVRWNQGSLAAAIESFEASLRLTGALVARHPDDVERLSEHAETLSWLGSVHWNSDDNAAALRRFQDSMRALQHATALAPDDTGVRLRLSWLIGNVGHVHERLGDLAAAETAYEQALDLCQQLVAAEPDNRRWQAELGDALDNLGKLAFLRGDLVEALAAYGRNDALKREAAADSADYLARSNRAISLQILGRTLMQAGAAAPALARLQRAVQLFDQVRQHDPSSLSNVASQALGLFDWAVALRMYGRPAEALLRLDEAREMVGTMSEAERNEVFGLEPWHALELERARLLEAVGRRDEAASQLAALAPVAAEVGARPNLDIDSLRLAAGSVLAAADFAHRRGQPDEARRQAEQALQMLDRHGAGSRTPTLQVLRVRALLQLERRGDAQPIVDALRAGGFGQPDFVAIVRAAGLIYPIDASLLKRITVDLPALD